MKRWESYIIYPVLILLAVQVIINIHHICLIYDLVDKVVDVVGLLGGFVEFIWEAWNV